MPKGRWHGKVWQPRVTILGDVIIFVSFCMTQHQNVSAYGRQCYWWYAKLTISPQYQQHCLPYAPTYLAPGHAKSFAVSLNVNTAEHHPSESASMQRHTALSALIFFLMVLVLLYYHELKHIKVKYNTNQPRFQCCWFVKFRKYVPQYTYLAHTCTPTKCR